MLIATFIEGDSDQAATTIYEYTYQQIDNPKEVTRIVVNGIAYKVVRYLANPLHPAYLFLVEPEKDS